MSEQGRVGVRAPGRAIAGAALAIALVATAFVVRETVIRVKGDRRDYSIEVTGSARRTVHATQVSWDGSVTMHVERVSDGHIALEGVRDRLRKYFVDQGLKVDAIHFPAVEVQERTEYVKGHIVSFGYDLKQLVHIDASDATSLAAAVSQSRELIDAAQIAGDAFVWRPGDVHFVYENFDRVKQAVLSDAVKNARIRVQAIAEAAGVNLATLRQIELGDIEVRSPGSNARYSDDAETPTKDIMADVKVLYTMR